ncbi:MAG: metallophosphoesterase [Candidatus Micrarchaeota archaeon]
MKIIYDAPAILHKGALVVGDTHFGMENKLLRKGIYDSDFSNRLFQKLKNLIIGHKVKTLILLGDVKEDITMLDRTTENILAKLSMLCKIIIVKGNHDGGIEKQFRLSRTDSRSLHGGIENCGNVEVKPAGGFVYEGLGLIHGHSWPAKELMCCKYLIAGHQHPMISNQDAFGKKHIEPVWVVADVDEENIKKYYKKFNKKIKFILMPAFNPVIGTPINNDGKTKFGPLINNKLFKLNDALLFRLSGICLGKFKI